jgi:hypothetical protein
MKAKEAKSEREKKSKHPEREEQCQILAEFCSMWYKASPFFPAPSAAPFDENPGQFEFC